VDTYLRFAEAAERLDLEAHSRSGVPELVAGAAGSGGLTGLIHGAGTGETAAGELGPAESDPIRQADRRGQVTKS
jgi:hypothetical protein